MMEVAAPPEAIVGLVCKPKMVGCESPMRAMDAPAFPVFWIELRKVPIDPNDTVPKAHAVVSGIFAITAPRGCMVSATSWGTSPAAFVASVRTSENAVGSLGFATFAGIGEGVTTIVLAPPIG